MRENSILPTIPVSAKGRRLAALPKNSTPPTTLACTGGREGALVGPGGAAGEGGGPANAAGVDAVDAAAR